MERLFAYNRLKAAVPRSSLVAILALCYVATLHALYQHVIAPDFSYLQYTYRSPDPTNYLLAIGLVVGLALLLPRRIGRPSQFIVWLVFLIAIAPSIVIAQYARALPPDEAMTVSLWAAFSYLPVVVFGTRRVLVGFVPQVRVRPETFWTLLLVGAVLSNAYLFARAPVLELPSLEDVYGLREEFGGVQDSDIVLRYLVPFMGAILNPILMLRGLFTRRWVWLVIGFAGQLLIYATSGNKTAILSPLALIAAFWVFRAARQPFGAIWFAGGTVLQWAMLAMDRLTASNDWTSLIVRRFIVTPGLLTAGYVSVFDDTEKAKLAHSFLSDWFTYPYQVDPPLIVGAQFFGNPGTYANANLLADGYANFGFPGMLLECLVFVVLLWIIDDAARGVPSHIASLVFLMPSLALVDSGIFTSILTHGFLGGIVLCMFLPKTGWDRPARGQRAAPGDPTAPAAAQRESAALAISRPVTQRSPASNSSQ